MPKWIVNPKTISDSSYHNDELLLADDDPSHIVARIEDFGNAIYPMAINAKTGNIERGGAFDDIVKAKSWCERVSGYAPPKSGDERPPFYYRDEPA